MMSYDLAVIGSGGAGFAAAIAARNKGRSVVMIEKGTVGGTCVNTGCVPSKALLAAAQARHVALHQTFPGVRTSAAAVELARLVGGKRELVESLRAGKYTDLAKEYGWEILRGTAAFTAGPSLLVELADGGVSTVEAAHYLIATGSAPWVPPVDGLAGSGYLTSTTAMELDTLPRSMIVLGGNAVGLEQAQLWQRLGVAVTVVEALPRLAPFAEPEIGTVLAGVFRDEGMAVHLNTTTTRVARDTTGYRLATTGGELRAEQLLVATGRRPVTAGLQLAEAAVATGEHGEVVIDEHLRTSNPRVWAAGDVTGHPQFVYVAAAHGTLVADNALDGARRTLDYHHLPSVTFTSPAIASAGLTEARAAEAGIAYESRELPLEHVPRALVDRDTRGLIKLVVEAGSGRLLGVHVIADGAGEVIATAVHALRNRLTVRELADTWMPYLTMSEGLKLAAQTFTRDVTKLSCCAS